MSFSLFRSGAVATTGRTREGDQRYPDRQRGTESLAARLGSFIAFALVLNVGTASAAQLNDVQHSTLSGGQEELTLVFDGPAPKPSSFAIEKPPRLVVDLPGVNLKSALRNSTVDGDRVHSWTAAQTSGRTRLVVALTNVYPYRLETNGNEMVVVVNPSGPAVTAAPARPEPAPQIDNTIRAVETSQLRRKPVISDAPRGELLDIDFRRGEDGQGRILLKLSDPGVQSEVRRRGTKVILQLRNTRLPGRFEQQYDVLDFGTPIKSLEARQVDNDTIISVLPVDFRFEQLAYQADDLYVLELQPLTTEEAQEKFPYDGEPVNLNFQKIEIRSLLEVLAEIANLNVIVSDTVRGDITMRLNNVPWDQALDIILKTKGLGKREAGNVIYVAPLEEIVAREQKEQEAQITAQELAPLQLELIQVNYARASDIASLLQSEGNRSSSRDGAATDENTSMLSSRGSVSVDARTNTLLVRETARQLEEIRNLVLQLDVPVKQVLIESRVVIANSNFTDELGVRWGTTYVDRNGDGLIGISGTAEGTSGIVGDFLTDGFPVAVPSLDQRLNVNTPPGGRAGGFGIAILGSNYLLDLELAALQAEGQGEVVSNPRVITADKHSAKIVQGTEIPFVNNTGDGGQTVTFKQVNLSLSVVPQITPDERIVMDLEVAKDDIGQVVQTTAGPAPSLTRRQVTTQVLVKDGETVVLGGVYETTKVEAETRVPVLGSLPLLGALFRSKSTTNTKQELLIFVSPKIVRESLTSEY